MPDNKLEKVLVKKLKSARIFKVDELLEDREDL